MQRYGPTYMGETSTTLSNDQHVTGKSEPTVPRQNDYMDEQEYLETLARIDIIFDALPGSPEERELERLLAMVEEYENIHYPIGEPTERAAREFRQDQERSYWEIYG